MRSKSLRKTRQIEYPCGMQLITARVGELGNKTLGAEFREVVAERSERVVLGGAAERFDDGGVDFGGSEGVAGGDVREAHQRMHERKLPGVIELEAVHDRDIAL